VLLQVTCAASREMPVTYPYMSDRGTIGFSRDGKTFFTWGARVVQAWDRAMGRERWGASHQHDCWSLAESPDSKTIATGSFDDHLHFWNAADGHEARPPIEHPGKVLTICFSPDGKLVGTGCGDNLTRVWDVSTGKLASAMSTADYLTDIRFTPDSRFAVNADAVGVRVYDARTGYAVCFRRGTAVGALPFLDISRDGHWAAISATNDYYCIVDIEKLTEVSKYSAEESLRWTELLSNSRLSGSAITNLTGAQWLELWRKHKADHPESHEF